MTYREGIKVEKNSIIIALKIILTFSREKSVLTKVVPYDDRRFKIIAINKGYCNAVHVCPLLF